MTPAFRRGDYSLGLCLDESSYPRRIVHVTQAMWFNNIYDWLELWTILEVTL